MSDSRLYVDTSDITAKVYTKTNKGVMYVKVTIPSWNMYINSFTVRQSPKHPDRGLWLQWPAFPIGKGKWVSPIEFEGQPQFKTLIEDEVMRAVDAYRPDEVVTDVDGPINLDDIPF